MRLHLGECTGHSLLRTPFLWQYSRAQASDWLTWKSSNEVRLWLLGRVGGDVVLFGWRGLLMSFRMRQMDLLWDEGRALPAKHLLFSGSGPFLTKTRSWFAVSPWRPCVSGQKCVWQAVNRQNRDCGAFLMPHRRTSVGTLGCLPCPLVSHWGLQSTEKPRTVSTLWWPAR